MRLEVLAVGVVLAGLLTKGRVSNLAMSVGGILLAKVLLEGSSSAGEGDEYPDTGPHCPGALALYGGI